MGKKQCAAMVYVPDMPYERRRCWRMAFTGDLCWQHAKREMDGRRIRRMDAAQDQTRGEGQEMA